MTPAPSLPDFSRPQRARLTFYTGPGRNPDNQQQDAGLGWALIDGDKLHWQPDDEATWGTSPFDAVLRIEWEPVESPAPEEGDYCYAHYKDKLRPCAVIGDRGRVWSRVAVFVVREGTSIQRVRTRDLISQEVGDSVWAFANDPLAVRAQGLEPSDA